MKKITWLLIFAMLITCVPPVTAEAEDEKTYVSTESAARTYVSEGYAVVKSVTDSAKLSIQTDQAGSYLSVYVYGFNVSADTVKPVFYDDDGNAITGDVKAVEKGRCGAYFRIEKKDSDAWNPMRSSRYTFSIESVNDKEVVFYQNMETSIYIYSPAVYYDKYDPETKTFTVYMSSGVDLDTSVTPVIQVISQNTNPYSVVMEAEASSVITEKNKFTEQYETKVSFPISMALDDSEWKSETFGSYIPKYQITYTDKNDGEKVFDSQNLFSDPMTSQPFYSADDASYVTGNKDVVLYYPYWVGGVYQFSNTGTESKYYLSKEEVEYLEGDRYFWTWYDSGTASLEDGVFQDKNYNGRAGRDACFVYEKTTVPELSAVNLATQKLVYTGKSQLPDITVTDTEGNTLTKDKDYTVSGAGTKPGTYTVTITGAGDYTGTLTTTYIIVPKKITNLKANLYQYGNKVQASWTKSTGASGYRVQWTQSGKTSTSYVTSASCTKASLTAKKKCTIKVTPYVKVDGVKKYGTSSTVTITPEAKGKFIKQASKPTVKKSSSTKAKVTWNKVANATGYQISCSTSSTSIVSKGHVTTRSKTITVTKGKKYYYKVRAYRVVNGKKVYGAWSAARTFTVK